MSQYKCTNCMSVTSQPLMRGSTGISVMLYVFLAIIGGVIYSIWRRGGKVCPACQKESLIPYDSNQSNEPDGHLTVNCEWCAEKIKPLAKVCKHCNHDVTPQPIKDTKCLINYDVSVDAEKKRKEVNFYYIIACVLFFLFATTHIGFILIIAVGFLFGALINHFELKKIRVQNKLDTPQNQMSRQTKFLIGIGVIIFLLILFDPMLTA